MPFHYDKYTLVSRKMTESFTADFEIKKRVNLSLVTWFFGTYFLSVQVVVHRAFKARARVKTPSKKPANMFLSLDGEAGEKD